MFPYFGVDVGLQQYSKIQLMVYSKGMSRTTLMDTARLASIWLTLKSLLDKGLNFLKFSTIYSFLVNMDGV